MLERMIGAALLKSDTYEDVERDESATSQALIVVVIAALSSGIGLFLGTILFVGFGSAFGAFISGLIRAPIAWVVASVVVYFVGSNLFRTPETNVTIGQVLRVLGFAQTPLVLGIVLIVPILGWLVYFLLALWVLVASVIAIRHAFDFDTGRAIGTAVVAIVIVFIINLLIGAIF
jgi:hypothetical protein